MLYCTALRFLSGPLLPLPDRKRASPPFPPFGGGLEGSRLWRSLYFSLCHSGLDLFVWPPRLRGRPRLLPPLPRTQGRGCHLPQGKEQGEKASTVWAPTVEAFSPLSTGVPLAATSLALLTLLAPFLSLRFPLSPLPPPIPVPSDSCLL